METEENEKKRKRSANLSDREKHIILDLVKKYFKIVENKKTNAVFNKQKVECWEKMSKEYNSLQTSGVRTGSQLKSAYECMKKIAKQHKSQDKVEITKTGGGTFQSILTSFDEKVHSLIAENYFQVENDMDSNNVATADFHITPTRKAINFSSSSGTIDTDHIASTSKTHNCSFSSVAEQDENIVIVWEDNDLSADKVSRKSPCDLNTNTDLNAKSQTSQSNTNKNNDTRKKTKNPTWKTIRQINDTKSEILKQKQNILAIKQIIKEKELVELEIKKNQLESSKSHNNYQNL